MLYDEATGRSYGNDVHANYIGGHVGLGKVFTYNNGRTLDVYGKYFHMKRDGVSFEAGGQHGRRQRAGRNRSADGSLEDKPVESGHQPVGLCGQTPGYQRQRGRGVHVLNNLTKTQAGL